MSEQLPEPAVDLPRPDQLAGDPAPEPVAAAPAPAPVEPAPAPEPAVAPVPTRTQPLSEYSGLSVTAKLDVDGSRFVFGVYLDGAWVPFADRRMGGILDDIQEALTPGFKAKRAEQYQREVLGQH